MSNQHLPVFIHDLAIILMTAGVTSVIFRWLKQPVVLGYMVAGILVGPHLPFLPTVTDLENVKIWGEIGVLFVLFSLGLEFSFQKLMRVGGAPAVTAIVQTSLVFCLGMLAGLALGWSHIDAVFWGGMMCIASTTIIFKVFEEKMLKARHFAQLVMGVLIVEDLVAVLLLVMLSTVAVTREFVGAELIWVTVRMLFFLILWFVIGLFVLPTLMRGIRRFLTPETTLIFSVGLCLFMVLMATNVGLSSALGAFVMGSLLAETSEGKRIEHLLHPVRDFFGAVFFVSVGMLFDPSVFAESWHLILGMSAFLIVAKTLTVMVGATIAGESMNTAVRSGLSLTQIGEFSFIIATLGMSLKVISPTLYPLVVGVSIVTSFTTPYLIASSDKIAGFIERSLPRVTLEWLSQYQLALQRQQGARFFPELVRAYAPLMVVNLVLLLAMSWLMRHMVYEPLAAQLGNPAWIRAAALTADLLICLPFYYGLSFRRPHTRWRERLATYPRFRYIQTVISIGRMTIGLAVGLGVTAQYMSWQAVSGILILALGLLAFIFYRYGERIYRSMENRFFDQLGVRRKETPTEKILPWDQHLSELTVGPDSPLVGMTIAQIGPQESFGVVVAAIERGQRRLLAPKATDVIFPFDRLQVLGSDDGVERIRKLAELTEPPIIDEAPLKLQSIVLGAGSKVVGKMLKESSIRDLVDGLVVGVERGEFRQLHPPADLRLEAGDRLWIVGDPDKIPRLN